MNKSSGFTLAEVLITLMAIGVVSAMTIPALMNNTNEKELTVAWKKTFATFSQIGPLIAMEKGGSLAGQVGTDIDDEDAFRDLFVTKLNTTKLCNDGTFVTGGCWHAKNAWYTLSGSKVNEDAWAGWSGRILSDGTFFGFNMNSTTCSANYSPNNDSCGTFLLMSMDLKDQIPLEKIYLWGKY